MKRAKPDQLPGSGRALLRPCWRIASVATLPTPAAAQQTVTVTGKINWGLWVDPDGCMHWWADGGARRLHDAAPRSEDRPAHVPRAQYLRGAEHRRAVRHRQRQAHRRAASAWLQQFFASAGAFAYAVYGHTDSRASASYNSRLSQNRANAVAAGGARLRAPWSTGWRASAKASRSRPTTRLRTCRKTVVSKSSATGTRNDPETRPHRARRPRSPWPAASPPPTTAVRRN